jgi:hypothetical protein
LTGEQDCLDIDQVYDLEGQLEEISQIILNEENVQSYQTGRKLRIKKKIEQIIHQFENNYKLKLKTEFKWKMHTLAIQKFWTKMLIKQNDWDQNNNPLTILRRNKSQYMDVIVERLKYGFNYDSDGLIAGNCYQTKKLLNLKIDKESITSWLLIG